MFSRVWDNPLSQIGHSSATHHVLDHMVSVDYLRASPHQEGWLLRELGKPFSLGLYLSLSLQGLTEGLRMLPKSARWGLGEASQWFNFPNVSLLIIRGPLCCRLEQSLCMYMERHCFSLIMKHGCPLIQEGFF